MRNIEQDNEERLECKICLDAPRAVRFQKCGHCCVCTDCYNELLQKPPEHRKCPLCNVHIGDAHSLLQTQAALQTFMASQTRGTNRQQRRAAEQRKDKAQRVRKLSHAEEKKALQRGRGCAGHGMGGTPSTRPQKRDAERARAAAETDGTMPA